MLFEPVVEPGVVRVEYRATLLAREDFRRLECCPSRKLWDDHGRPALPWVDVVQKRKMRHKSSCYAVSAGCQSRVNETRQFSRGLLHSGLTSTPGSTPVASWQSACSSTNPSPWSTSRETARTAGCTAPVTASRVAAPSECHYASVLIFPNVRPTALRLREQKSRPSTIWASAAWGPLPA